MSSILIKNGTLITSDGERKSDILIENNRIAALLTTHDKLPTSSETDAIDASGLLIMPGLIDCHVHFREPGLEHKETMGTGYASALAGGVTTVCEMPNTIPPAVTVEAFADKVRRASKVGDIRFFFGATQPKHLIAFRKIWLGEDVHLRELRARCSGLKLYFDHSTGNQGAEMRVIEDAFKLCGEMGATVVCHCEDAKMNSEFGIRNSGMDIADHSKIRPPESEGKAVKDALALAKKYGTHLHVAHLSTKGGLDLIRTAKKSGVNVTCEVAPHHLFLTVDDYPKLGTLAKMNPPLRTREHQDALWVGIADGTVDCVSTDHAPHTLEEKNAGDPLKAPSGVPGVETMLPLLLTAVAQEKMSYADIVRLCFTNPNRIFQLGKWGIAEGAPADLTLVDPVKKWTIRGSELHSKCGWSPFEGWDVTGKAVQVVR